MAWSRSLMKIKLKFSRMKDKQTPYTPGGAQRIGVISRRPVFRKTNWAWDQSRAPLISLIRLLPRALIWHQGCPNRSHTRINLNNLASHSHKSGFYRSKTRPSSPQSAQGNQQINQTYSEKVEAQREAGTTIKQARVLKSWSQPTHPNFHRVCLQGNETPWPNHKVN